LDKVQAAFVGTAGLPGFASEDDVLIGVMRQRYGRSNMKVLLDTDVVVTALVFPESDSGRVVRLVADRGRIVLSDFTEEDLLTTYSCKLPDLASALAQFLEELDYEVAGPTGLTVTTSTELDDTRLVDAAISAKVDVIVTNDRRFKTIGLATPVVLTPGEYLR
jgi:predicted nucleic acid-binding protein